MTDSNTVLDSYDLLGSNLDSLHDSHNRERSLDAATLKTISDSDRLSYLIATSDPSELVVQTASKVIENEIHSFFNSFSTSTLQINTVPILVFPQHLGKIVNKCIRYYASIYSLAPFYIDVHGVKVLAACSNKYLRAHHIEDYKNLFLSRPEDCEHVSISHLFNCILENKNRNNLRRNLLKEFTQDNLISESSDLKRFEFLGLEDSSTLSVPQEILKQEKKDLKIKDDVVRESNLNINAQEFVPQTQCAKSEVIEDSDLVVTNEISTIYSFLPMSSVKADSDLTLPYLFIPDSTSKDYLSNSECFKLGSTSSNSTPRLSFDPSLSSERSYNSIQSDVNLSLRKSLLHVDSYYVTRKHKDNKHSFSKHSMTEPVIRRSLSMRKYTKLVSSLKAECSKAKLSHKSALAFVTKNLEEEDSLKSLPQFSSDLQIPISAPKYFTSTPKSKSFITKENVSPFSFSYAASTSSDLNTARSSMELTLNDNHSPTTENSQFDVASIQQPDSPISFSEGSEKQLESYEQPLSSLTSSSSYEQVFRSSSNMIGSSTASTSLMYYTAELLSSSTDLSNAQCTLSSSILSPRIPEVIPTSLLSVQPTTSTENFETPLAPTRYSPHLQLLAITGSDSPISSIIPLSANSQDKTTTTSVETSFVATSIETSLTPISTSKKSDTPEEFTSTRSTISEKADDPFMEGSKYYIDYVIEYKDFMEQASKFIKGSPLLVRSLRTVEEFKCSLKRHTSIVELYNIPESCKTLDLLRIYQEEPRCMIWCDGSHVLLVNQSPEQAKRALKLEHEFIRSRPIEDGSPVATVIACSYKLEPVFETLDKWIQESRNF